MSISDDSGGFWLVVMSLSFDSARGLAVGGSACSSPQGAPMPPMSKIELYAAIRRDARADDHPAAAGSVAMDDAGDDAGGGRRGRRAAPTAELAAVLGRCYGLHAEHAVDLGGSSSLNLLVGDGPDRCVVRVYRPHVTTGRLAAIQHVRGELRHAGVPCPTLVPTRDGRPWVRLGGVGGRLVEVERFVDHDAIMDRWDRLLAGLPLLGRIHAVLQPIRVSAEGRRPRFVNYLDPAQAVAATAQAAARIRGWRPTPAEARLARLAEELAARVAAGEAALGTHALPRQLVHGDFWDNNVGFRGGRVVLVGDLEFMGDRPRVDDLALTLHFAAATLGGAAGDDAGGAARIARLRRLVDAYDGGLHVPLSAAERAALPWALARQPLWAVGGWLVWLDDQRAARRLAASMLGEVEDALRLVAAIDRWQQGFA
jgi:Ser/Thr protein kinase RdoA (MazF antagonist)